MVAKIDLISETSHKHAGEVSALCFDGEHLYSGSEDGVINVWNKDLKFSREIALHKDFAVISLAVNEQNQIYSSGRDGTLRFFRRPWSHDHNEILLQTVMDDITAMTISDNTLYTGDDKGIVTKWYHNQVGCQYNVMEEVMSIAIEGFTLYTVRETDVIITDIKPGMTSHVMKGSFPGRAPLVLVGPEDNDKHKKYIAAATRDGKGFVIASNEVPFKVLTTKENAHSMLINAMCTVDDFLFTTGYDGKVKKWKNLDKDPVLVEEIDTGKCINTICAGPDHTVFTGDSEGLVKRLRFST